MQLRVITNFNHLGFLLIFSILFSIPLIQASAQITSHDPLGVYFVNTQPYSFKDDSGYTIVLGEIENTRDFSINDVRIWTGFYNQFSDQPIETITGTTIIDTIPPKSKVPFSISSLEPNAAISRVAVNLVGFNSATEKESSLSIQTRSLELGDSLYFEGSIRNNADIEASNVKVYLMSKDTFDPPRIVGLTQNQFTESLGPGETMQFIISDILNSKAVSFSLIAESDNHISEVTFIEAKNIHLESKQVVILDVMASNVKQDKTIISSPVQISAQILMKQNLEVDNEQPFVFYTQIKQADTGIVEFVHSTTGNLYPGPPQIPSIIWIPENKGLFFIETFVWDTHDVALASTGPITIVNVESE